MVDEQPSESMPDEGDARQDASWREGPASEAVEPLLESSELDATSLPILEEEPIQPSPEPRLTDAPSPSAPASAVAIEAHAEPEAQAQPTRDAQPQPPRGAWRRSVGLVLLGGLFGVILTLLAALVWAGTVDFAPRRQVDALSRNVNTMYANQELAWQRLDELTLRADELERKTKRLEGLEARVGTLEGELQSAQQELVDSRQQVAQLSEALYALQEEQRQGMAQLDERLAKAEAEIGALSTSFQAISQQFDIVQARMRAFDGFFTGLRALLQEMNEDNQPNPGVLPLAPRSVTTPTPTPAKPATGG